MFQRVALIHVSKRFLNLRPIRIPPCISKGMLVRIYKHEGQRVRSHEPVALLESGNASIEVNSDDIEGKVIAVNYEMGEIVRSGDDLMVIDTNHSPVYYHAFLQDENLNEHQNLSRALKI